MMKQTIGTMVAALAVTGLASADGMYPAYDEGAYNSGDTGSVSSGWGNATPLGAELIGGYRTRSIWRGFLVGNQMLDLQGQTQFNLAQNLVLGAGGWYGTELDHGNNTDAAGFVDLRFDQEQLSIGGKVTAHAFNHPLLESGVEFSPYLQFRPMADTKLTLATAYDTGAKGWYSWLEGERTYKLNDSAFFTGTLGAGYAADYYNRTGMEDLYGRLGFTYRITKNFAVTPFVGFSRALSANPEADWRGFGGVWGEFSF